MLGIWRGDGRVEGVWRGCGGFEVEWMKVVLVNRSYQVTVDCLRL